MIPAVATKLLVPVPVIFVARLISQQKQNCKGGHNTKHKCFKNFILFLDV